MARDHPPADEETPDQRWDALIEVAEPDVDVTGLEPRPCTGRLIQPAPGRDPVTTLRTEFESQRPQLREGDQVPHARELA